jgi:hypothetical protein
VKKLDFSGKRGYNPNSRKMEGYRLCKVREWLRCPVCGKLSDARNFAIAQEGMHRIEIMIQEIYQGEKGYLCNRWYRKDMGFEERRDLMDAMLLILEKVIGKLRNFRELEDRAIDALRNVLEPVKRYVNPVEKPVVEPVRKYVKPVMIDEIRPVRVKILSPAGIRIS